MKLGDFFEVAINQGDWVKVCQVYTQITGKPIQPPPQPKAIADIEMNAPAPVALADTEMGPVGEDKWEEEGGAVDPEDDEPIEPVEDSGTVQQAKPSHRQPTVDDFRVERVQASDDEDGSDNRRATRREIINFKNKRKNRFDDEALIKKEKLHLDESVQEHPELGVKNPTPRNKRGTEEGAPDTSKKVKVVCSLCGEKDTIAQALAVGWHKDKPNCRPEDKQNTYKCNTCQTPGGRAKLLRAQRNR